MHAQTRAKQRLPAIAFACGGAFSFAGNVHHRPLGQNVQTLAISCQRLPSLLRFYFNTSHCAILCFACFVFLRALDTIKTPRGGTTWNGSHPHQCRTTRSKKFPKLALTQRATTSSQRARAGSGSGAENTKNARAGGRGSRPFRASRSVKETTSDPCGFEDPQGSLGQ